MNVIWDFILVFSAIGMAVTYLFFIQYIRQSSNQIGVADDNFFILNFYKVYKKYIDIRKHNKLKCGIMLYLHFLFIIITLILGYFLEGK